MQKDIMEDGVMTKKKKVSKCPKAETLVGSEGNEMGVFQSGSKEGDSKKERPAACR